MRHWNSGFRPKLFSGKLGPGELWSFKLGRVGRSCRIVWIKKALATEARVKGVYVPLIGSAELDPLRESKTSREMELGTGDSGQYMSERVILINKIRSVGIGQGDEFQSGMVLRCPGTLCLSLVSRAPNVVIKPCGVRLGWTRLKG